MPIAFQSKKGEANRGRVSSQRVGVGGCMHRCEWEGEGGGEEDGWMHLPLFVPRFLSLTLGPWNNNNNKGGPILKPSSLEERIHKGEATTRREGEKRGEREKAKGGEGRTRKRESEMVVRAREEPELQRGLKEDAIAFRVMYALVCGGGTWFAVMHAHL